jgi:threonyl-tRNA synthetase
LWLALVQLGIVRISEKHTVYAQSVKVKLDAAGLRVELIARAKALVESRGTSL